MIKDNSVRKKDTFYNISTLMGKIANKSLEQLEREVSVIRIVARGSV